MSQTEELPVTFITRLLVLKGTLHVNRSDKSHRRLSELLNTGKKFIVLTDVTAHPLPGQNLPSNYFGTNRIAFLHVNTESIELVLPQQDIPEE